MKRLILYVIPILLCSCSTSRHIQMEVAEHISKDTIYLSNVQYDSIYVASDHYVDRSRDTILIKDKQIEYRYRLLRDTIFVKQIEIQHDSIPYEVRITEVKEVKKPPNHFDYLCYLCLGVVIVVTTWKIKRLFC